VVDTAQMVTWRRLSRAWLFLPLPVMAVAGLVWPLSHADAPPTSAGEAAYQSLPAKPAGDGQRGRAGVERSAIAVAAWLHAVPVGATSTATCAPDQLAVSWSAPTAGATEGAYIGPLGPAPTASTTAVNGIVVCRTSDYAFMGFQARYVGSRWDVVAVPTTDSDVAPPAEPAAPLPAGTVSFDGRTFAAAIEAPASYEPQRTCDPTAKVGTVALKNLLLKTYPGSRSLGISRECSADGVSEHKEGRAFDWGVRVTVASEKAMAQSFIDKVLATDQYGNQFALARRMGIMYLIWDHHIWSTYRAAEGWRDYHGVSPHTDHIHISMAWAGALGRTSFWSVNVAQELAASTPSNAGGSQVAAAVKPVKARAKTTATTAPRRRNVTIDTQLAADQRAARRAQWEAANQARQAQWAADQAAREAEREAARPRHHRTPPTAPTSSTSTTSTTSTGVGPPTDHPHRRSHPPGSTTTTTSTPNTTTTVPSTTSTTGGQ